MAEENFRDVREGRGNLMLGWLAQRNGKVVGFIPDK